MQINESPQGSYPATVSVEYPERSSRLYAVLALLFLFPKIILLAPHLIILWVLGIVSLICFVIAQFAVLFTGNYPKRLFNVVEGTLRWQVRTNAFFLGLTDKYPPFSLK